MNNYLLSVVIPARSEMFLARTIQDIIENSSEQTEVIAVLDGVWADPPINDHPRVNLIYLSESIGQRAATNLGVKLSRAKYVAKADAHISVDKDFDVKMLEAFKRSGDNVVMVPEMRNLHAFNWKCYSPGCDWEEYQGARRKICPKCGKRGKVRMKMIWRPRRGTHSRAYCFDSEPKFRYFQEYELREEYIKDKQESNLTKSMSLQGSFFMATRENYWNLKLCDESLGNWGGQGIEVACKIWLSGGEVLVAHSTWYAHLFRTRHDFTFPWPVSGRDQQRVKKNVKDLLWGGKYDKAIYPVSKIVEQFWPVPGWSDEQLKQLKEYEKKHGISKKI